MTIALTELRWNLEETFWKETTMTLQLNNQMFYSCVLPFFFSSRNTVHPELWSLIRAWILKHFYFQHDHLWSLAYLYCNLMLCLTTWVESSATLHGAILSQFPQLSQAENEQSTDKCKIHCRLRGISALWLHT